MTTLYKQLVAVEMEIENHYSDMYVPVNEVTTRLVQASGKKYSVFKHQIKQTMWYDIPFAYEPFWEKTAARI